MYSPFQKKEGGEKNTLNPPLLFGGKIKTCPSVSSPPQEGKEKRGKEKEGEEKRRDKRRGEKRKKENIF